MFGKFFHFTKRHLIPSLVVGAALTISSAMLVSADSPVTYYACNAKGTLYRVSTQQPTCRQGDTLMNWNQVGPMGPAGPQGQKGDTGAVGPAGPQGPKGDTGAQGLQGEPGPVGAKGETGDIGPAGPQGLKGDKGDVGPKGDMGPQGPTGDTGPAGQDGVSGIETVTASIDHLEAGEYKWLGVMCPGQKLVTGGGFDVIDPGIEFRESKPWNDDGWIIYLHNPNIFWPTGYGAEVYAICATAN